MSYVYTTTRSSAMRTNKKPEPPQARAGIMEEGILLSFRDKMMKIALRYAELIVERKTNSSACRIIADEFRMGVHSVEKAVIWLKKNKKIEINSRIRDDTFGPEKIARLIKRRNELALEGNTERKISSIIASELGLGKTSVWYKIQQLIREGSLPPKRELSRQIRRSSSFSAARGEMEKPRRQKKTKERDPSMPAPMSASERLALSLLSKEAGLISKPAEKPASQKKSRHIKEDPATVEMILKFRRRIEKFVPIDSGAVPQEKLGIVTDFIQSDLGGKKRFSVQTVGQSKQTYFSLAKTLRVEAAVHGSKVLFRESDIPGIIFYATLERGKDAEASQEITSLGTEMLENKLLFPSRVPFWLDLKIWAARHFCLESNPTGKNSAKIRKIDREVRFERLSAFFSQTMKNYPHLHPD
jgi:hypothetical protein